MRYLTRIMNKEIRADIGIVGGGVTGLMLSKKLAEIGYSVALVDKSPTLANGPSTRNEGWLHRGTYHATSIKDRATSIAVAQRCIYGHNQIRQFAPETVEDSDTKSFAVVREEGRVDEITSRWDEADVQYAAVPTALVENMIPEANLKASDTVFKVGDVGINTRLLYQKLYVAGKRAGVQHILNTEIQFTDQSLMEAQLVNGEGEKTQLATDLFIHTSGHGMKAFFDDNFGLALPMRFWKSHLLVTPRLSRDNLFAVDPGEAGMMNHGKYSIVGANEDAELVDAPDYTIEQDGVAAVENALRKLYKPTGAPTFPVACIKVDMPLQSEAARSLNINVSEPVDNHLCVLPGKMTESVYVTDAVTRLVFDRKSLQGKSPVTPRPCDTL